MADSIYKELPVTPEDIVAAETEACARSHVRLSEDTREAALHHARELIAAIDMTEPPELKAQLQKNLSAAVQTLVQNAAMTGNVHSDIFIAHDMDKDFSKRACETVNSKIVRASARARE